MNLLLVCVRARKTQGDYLPQAEILSNVEDALTSTSRIPRLSYALVTNGFDGSDVPEVLYLGLKRFGV